MAVEIHEIGLYLSAWIRRQILEAVSDSKFLPFWSNQTLSDSIPAIWPEWTGNVYHGRLSIGHAIRSKFNPARLSWASCTVVKGIGINNSRFVLAETPEANNSQALNNPLHVGAPLEVRWMKPWIFKDTSGSTTAHVWRNLRALTFCVFTISLMSGRRCRSSP
jgi:hypothetical protein